MYIYIYIHLYYMPLQYIYILHTYIHTSNNVVSRVTFLRGPHPTTTIFGNKVRKLLL